MKYKTMSLFPKKTEIS